jgi:hypothetical protein
MPEAFDRCVRRGGSVRTIKPREDVFIHVCYPKGGGSPVHGEVKHVKNIPTNASQAKEIKK